MKKWGLVLIPIMCLMFVVGILSFFNVDSIINVNAEFTENEASMLIDSGKVSLTGGQLFLGKGTDMSMDEGVISGGIAMRGGAVYISNGASFTMNGGTITGNTAVYGGAIYVESGGTLILNAGTISNNTAQFGYQGDYSIYIEEGANITISENMVFEGNIKFLYIKFAINVYVDGYYEKTIKIDSNIFTTYVIQEEEVPLDYEHCCGYFFDKDLTRSAKGVEIPVVSDESINIYTKSVTDSEIANNFKFTLNSDNISYSIAAKDSLVSGELVMPAYYNGYPVTTVSAGDYSYSVVNSFEGCEDMTNIVFSSSITTIKDNAFCGCLGITSLKLPNTILSLGSNTFEECLSLSSIYFPESIINIGYSTFTNIYSECAIYIEDIGTLFNISFDIPPKSLFFNISDEVVYTRSEDGGWVELTDLVIPEGVTQLYGNFAGCKTIQTVTMPESLITIDRYSFYSCSNLTSVTFADSGNLKYIKGDAFYNCSKLQELIIPEGVESLGGAAFQDCISISNLSIPSTLQNIESSAFDGCALDFIDVHDNNTVYTDGDIGSVEGNCLINKANMYLIKGSSTSILPYGLIGIGANAFKGNTKLTNISIPTSVTTIEYNAFYDCVGLTYIYLPSNVTQINAMNASESPFSGCTNMTGIYCEVTSKPSGWSSYFNYKSNNEQIPVYWGIDSSYRENSFYGLWVYSVENEEATIIKYLGAETEIEIPSMLPGGSIIGDVDIQTKDVISYVPVTTIIDKIFYGDATITKLVISDSVTTIGASAFEGCSGLIELTIGEAVVDIGNLAFADCVGLLSINFNAINMNNLTSEISVFKGVGEDAEGITLTFGAKVEKIPEYLFYYSVGLVGEPLIKIVNFEEGSVCESIGRYSFYGCHNITEIIIPENITSIGDSAFSSSNILEKVNFNAKKMNDLSWSPGVFPKKNNDVSWFSVNIGKDVTYIPANLFYGCDVGGVIFEEDSKCKSVGESAFYGTPLRGSVVLPSGMLSIGDSSFRDTALTAITIPDTVTNIGKGAFAESLIEIVNGLGSVSTINAELFAWCANLKEITIPDTVTSIGVAAFHCCYDLATINIPESVTIIYGKVFQYCDGLKQVQMSSSVTSIGENAFAYCYGLEEVILSNNITYIAKELFKSCTSLTSVAIPNKVNRIAASSFYGCNSLANITIPKGILSIGENAFYNCVNLTINCEFTEEESTNIVLYSNWNYGVKATIYASATSFASNSIMVVNAWNKDDYSLGEIILYERKTEEETVVLKIS